MGFHFGAEPQSSYRRRKGPLYNKSDGSFSGTPPTERVEGCTPASTQEGMQLMPALRLQSTTGPTLDLLILQIRDWCRTHQVEAIKFTYQLAGRSPQLCIECHLDADIEKLALAFPGGNRLLNCHNLAFTV